MARNHPLMSTVFVKSEGRTVAATVTHVRGEMRIVRWTQSGQERCATLYSRNGALHANPRPEPARTR